MHQKLTRKKEMCLHRNPSAKQRLGVNDNDEIKRQRHNNSNTVIITASINPIANQVHFFRVLPSPRRSLAER